MAPQSSVRGSEDITSINAIGGKIILYLDTQDFSRFADCLNGRGTSEAKAVLDGLLPEIDAGRVIAPVSMAHISELLQYEGGGRDLTLRKAEAIERLSGRYAFRDFNDMVAADLIDFAVREGYLRQPPPRPRHFPLDDEGQWHAPAGRVLDDFRGQVERQFDSGLKEQHGLPRALRRKAKAMMRSGGWAEVLSGLDAEQEMRQLATNYPVTERFIRENLFLQLLLGKVRPEVVEAEIFKGLRQPTRFVEWYFERYDGDRDLPYWMKSLGADLAASMMEMKGNLPSADIPTSMKDALLAKQAAEFSLSISANLFGLASSELKKYGLGQFAIDRLLAMPARSQTPMISQITAIAIQFIKRHMVIGTNSPRVKESDGGDFVHALYIPHCHIWRGDGSSADLARQAFRGTKTRIIGKLRDLPEAISAIQVSMPR